MATERITVKPGQNFDPSNALHLDAVLKNIAEKTEHGTGWKMQSFNPDDGSITLTRQSAVTQIAKSTKHKNSYDVGLRTGTKPTDGEQVAALLESDPRHQGYIMTAFEPFLGQATLSKLNVEEQRCRGAVAVALTVKPWDVQVSQTADGGFSLKLHRSYVPSKHDAKLAEVAETIVGRDGWFVKTNANALTAEIIPSDPPTFPTVVPYPLAKLKTVNPDRTPFGVKLQANGDEGIEEAFIDWKAQGFAMVAGMPSSGKSVTLNAIIAGELASGVELVICDIPDKKVDFLWAKKYCRNSGWGADSDVATLAALSLVYEEGKRRSKIIEQYGVVNWMELPAGVDMKPILVIVDELSGLLVTEKLPTGVPKDNPIVIAKTMRNLVRVSIEDIITRILAEQRAFGIRAILSTQVTNANTGIGPSQKAKIGHKILQGSNPSKTARGQAFNDESSVPLVPGNIRADQKVAKGVGVAELEGIEPFVYKSYYASVDDYQRALKALGVTVSGQPEPTAAEIARFDPSEEMDVSDTPPSRMRDEVGGFGRPEKHVKREDGYSGAAAAGHDLLVQAQAANRAAAAAG